MGLMGEGLLWQELPRLPAPLPRFKPVPFPAQFPGPLNTREAIKYLNCAVWQPGCPSNSPAYFGMDYQVFQRVSCCSSPKKDEPWEARASGREGWGLLLPNRGL